MTQYITSVTPDVTLRHVTRYVTSVTPDVTLQHVTRYVTSGGHYTLAEAPAGVQRWQPRALVEGDTPRLLGDTGGNSTVDRAVQ